MSLRARLALVLAGVLAGPIVAAGLVVAVVVPRARASADAAALRHTLASASAYLQQRCAALGDLARSTALDLSTALTSGQELTAARAGDAASTAVRGRQAEAPAVVLVVANGRALAGRGPGGTDAAESPARLPAGADLQALATASCSRGFAPPTGGPAQAESVPVTDAGGHEVARVVAVGALDDAAVAALLHRLGLAPGLTVLSAGRPVAGAAGEGNAGEVADDLAAAVAAAGAHSRSAVSGTAGHVRYQSAAPAAGIPYGLLAWTSEGSGALPWLLAAGAIAAIVACVLLLLLVTTRLTRPLLRLARTAARLRQGDLTVRSGVPVGPAGADEVATLAAAFDAMAGRLAGDAEDLQAGRAALAATTTRFATALAHTHDLDGLLTAVLDTVREAAGASAGWGWLGEPRALEERATSVPGGATAGRPARAVGESLAALARSALERGEPARSTDPVPGLAVPLRGGNRLLGALGLAREQGDPPFDEATVRAVAAFAGPAGVAVANVLEHEETRRLSVTDPLTGAGNFRHLSTTLAREVERATRFSHPLSVVMLDLDHFKAVNDTHGHAFGDGVLREVARRLQDCLREVDTVARYGGEEFTVVLPETGAEGAAAVAARIVDAVRSRPFRVGVTTAQITVSAGVAAFPDHGRTASEILRAADAALYVAKTAGRDQWCLAEVVLPGRPAGPALPQVLGARTEPAEAGPGPDPDPARRDVPAAPPGRAG